ncbi:MAG: hypothetical protein AB7V32_08295, partial [Candidatus Berkiella sp.]
FGKEFFKAFLIELNISQDKWEPWLAWASNAIGAISTFISTLKTSLVVIPIVFSTIALLTGPSKAFIYSLLPTIIFDPMVITALVVSIAGIAAYRSYQDGIERDKLDGLTESHAKDIPVLEKKIIMLEEKLASFERNLLQNSSREKNTKIKRFALKPKNDQQIALVSPQKIANLSSRLK